MTRLIARCLRSAVADSRAERAVAETLLDIRTEWVEAHGTWSQVGWCLRSTVALVRVIFRALLLDLGGLITGGWTFRLAAWTLLLLTPLVLGPLMSFAGSAQLSNPTKLILATTLVPQGFALVLPISAFLTALWPSRRSSASAAVQGVTAALMVLIMIQVTPVANQVFRAVAFAATSSQPFSISVPARGLRELTTIELARAAFASDSDRRTARQSRSQLLALTGLVGAAGTFTLLGGLLARRARTASAGRRRLWPYAVGLPAITLLSLGALNGTGVWVASLVALALAIHVASAPSTAERIA